MMGGVHMWWNSVLKNSTRGGRSPHVVGGVHTWWEESTRGGRSPHVVAGVHTVTYPTTEDCSDNN